MSTVEAPGRDRTRTARIEPLEHTRFDVLANARVRTHLAFADRLLAAHSHVESCAHVGVTRVIAHFAVLDESGSALWNCTNDPGDVAGHWDPRAPRSAERAIVVEIPSHVMRDARWVSVVHALPGETTAFPLRENAIPLTPHRHPEPVEG